MLIPTLPAAENLLAEGHKMNPGPWMDHSHHAAEAARAIAAGLPGLDPDLAYILGLLHDIGRRYGVSQLRHAMDGYRFLHDQGYEDAARICLTHSFPLKDIRAIFGKNDCNERDTAFMGDYLAAVDYTDYDLLIQLCDALVLPTGFCLLEKRMIDAALRYDVNEFTVAKWKAIFQIKRQFETIMGRSIYDCLPGVRENTFATELVPA